MAQEDEVAEAVHFGVGAKDVDSLADLTSGECGAAIGQHFFEDGRHLSKVARASESMRPLTERALLAKLRRRSPMRSRPIMNFMQARNSRASAGPTSVMAVVTPLSISRSSVSRSRSRWRSELRRTVEPWQCPRPQRQPLPWPCGRLRRCGERCTDAPARDLEISLRYS